MISISAAPVDGKSKRGGLRRNHSRGVIPPEKVKWADEQLGQGKLLVGEAAAALGVSRSTLLRALKGQGTYSGILTDPKYRLIPISGTGRNKVRNALTKEQVKWALLELRAGRLKKQIDLSLGVSPYTVYRAVRGMGRYEKVFKESVQEILDEIAGDILHNYPWTGPPVSRGGPD